jgi:hypothetical protein
MAAEAMAKAPPASMAPDKALMTLAAHKPPPPPPKYPQWGSFTVYDKGDQEWYKDIVSKHQLTNFITTSQYPSSVKFGNAVDIQADMQFDEETKVAMSVGKDGHLWLKINDGWKRIVTE